MKKAPAPSPEQLTVLRHMALDPACRLIRLPGGFWTTPSTPIKGKSTGSRFYAPTDIPEWSTTVQTVRAMEKRGWVRRTNTHPEEWRDEREMTEAGRAQAPKETP